MADIKSNEKPERATTGNEKGAVSEGVNSLCARGSVRYSARFHEFSHSSSTFSMATAMLC